jgi:hypothetical protein
MLRPAKISAPATTVPSHALNRRSHIAELCLGSFHERSASDIDGIAASASGNSAQWTAHVAAMNVPARSISCHGAIFAIRVVTKGFLSVF